MRKYISVLLAAGVSFGATAVIAGNTSNVNNDDAKALADYFVKKFPGVKTESLVNGAYALDESLYSQFENIEEFPPYEDFVAKGEAFYNTAFKNGKSFADCFGDDVRRLFR
jgi:sulfur-oxidizing protein SoxA